MKLARSALHAALGIALLALLIAVAMVIVDERLSRQLDEVDLTYEEFAQEDFAPGVARRLP